MLLGDHFSTFWPLAYRVPQGSPVLISTYMKTLGEVLRHDGMQCHQYADIHNKTILIFVCFSFCLFVLFV